MRTTIDRAGRVVIPKRLRDELGLRAGPVEVTSDGASLRVEPVTPDEVVEEDGHLVIPRGGASIDDDLVRALRFADQR
jgi:AbrB family looped-hinge helix DNA binding protein